MAVPLDPQAEVSAPVRRALDGIIVRGAVSFGAVAASVHATAAMTDGPLHAVAHVVLPAVLTAVIVGRGAWVWLRGAGAPTGDAWSRAREVEPADARLATLVLVLLPSAWIVGGGAIIARHVDHHSLGVVLGIAVPIVGAMWLLATIAWVHDCRERLARALDDSDRRFREYWAQLGTSG